MPKKQGKTVAETAADIEEFMQQRVKTFLTPEEIIEVFGEVIELIDISANYECFGPNADRAESAYGHLLELLTDPTRKLPARKPPKKARSQPRKAQAGDLDQRYAPLTDKDIERLKRTQARVQAKRSA